MAAIVATAGEFERVEENSKGSPIPTLEPALRRAPCSSSRVAHKRGSSSIGHK
jgi:hypothetical protein